MIVQYLHDFQVYSSFAENAFRVEEISWTVDKRRSIAALFRRRYSIQNEEFHRRMRTNFLENGKPASTNKD